MPISINGTTASVTGLTNGTQYRFRVAARNAVGLGPYTAATSPGSPSGDPGPPPTPGAGESWTAVPAPLDEFGWPKVNDIVAAGTRIYSRPAYQQWLRAPNGAPSQAFLDGLQNMAPMYSTDGASWAQSAGFWRVADGYYQGWQPLTVLYDLARVGAGQDYYAYVAVGSYSATPDAPVSWGWSTDGAAWVEAQLAAGSIRVAAAAADTAAYDGWRFTASSPDPVGMLHSIDGITWQHAPNIYLAAVGGSYGLYRYRDPSTGSYGSTYVAGIPDSADVTPATRYSTNLPLSARPFYAATPGSDIKWVATTTSGTYYTAVSPADSLNTALWTERTLPQGFTPAPRSAFRAPVAYGNGHWLMLARPAGATEFRTLLRSADAIAWTPLTTLPSTAAWRDIAFFNGYFYAGGGTTSSSLTGLYRSP